MPRTAKQNQAIRDKRKAKITQEGIKLISLYGLNNVVIDDIAKEVGCSHGLFYHYYKRTEDLYADIPAFILNSKRLSTYVNKYTPIKDLSPAEGLKLFSKNMEELPSYPTLALHTANIIFSSEQAMKDFGYYDFYIRKIKEGQKDGTFKEADPETLLVLFLDVIGGYIGRVLKEGSKATAIPADLLAGVLLK